MYLTKQPTKFDIDHIVFSPRDVDLSKSPLKDIGEETYVLGAFNPGMNILPNGNLILMVRVAESLKTPVKNGCIRQIRWSGKGYVFDEFHESEVDSRDPRTHILKKHKHNEVHVLTSFSWILPVELSSDGSKVLTIHYDKIITATKTYQEFGVEDPRVSIIEGIYYMTTCSISSQRQATTLYTSSDGINYKLEGIVLDHGNKDMILFEGKINDKFFALTRPLGRHYFPSRKSSGYMPGPSINMATSYDAQYWRPTESPLIRIKDNDLINERVGGGAPPILTERGWLILYHGVQATDGVGIYRTFWALLDKNNPHKIIDGNEKEALLKANANLTKVFNDQIYLDNVVFSTGIIKKGNHFIIASGELDLCCRITHIAKEYFNL